jgi:hypothetical protein
MEKPNKKSQKPHLEPYFRANFLSYGKYEFPFIEKQKIDLENLSLMRFSSAVPDETENLDATIHFFEYDDEFDETWKNPDKYINELAQYKQVMSPNFSLYTNMAFSLQIWNTFRSRYLGALWQSKGLTVIPTINWADKSSFDFCFESVESGSVVSVSTVGCADVKWIYLNGFEKMVETIKPEKVICYAKPFDEMFDMADILEVPYVKTEKIARAKSEKAT